MTEKNFEKRNFLLFLSDAHSLSIEDSLIGALATPSSWNEVAAMVSQARAENSFVRSIRKVQLYIHVPFCGRLCTFCHCARVLLRRRTEIDAYIKDLKRQMASLAPAYNGMKAGLVSFGGGTPSVLDEKQMTDILDGIDKAFPAGGRKILYEINPSSWTASKLAVLSNRGLSRLSIGVQTLDDKVLKRVSRSQTRKKVLWCIASARKAGVPHVNIDLMAGLPGQTVRGLINDLKALIDEGASIVHVHPYCSLSLKEMCGEKESVPGFFKRRDAMMREAAGFLQAIGFRRQGLGAYTRNGEGEDHQDEVYTHFEAAIAAFGPSAKGQFPGAVFYRVNTKGKLPHFIEIEASKQDTGYTMAHYTANALIYGLDENAFHQRFGVSLDHSCKEGLKFLQQFGLVSFSKGVWKFSGKWEVNRIREFVALSRVLFGEDLLARLRSRFQDRYDPRQDYSTGSSMLKAFTNSWLMSLYYRMGI